MNSEEKGAIAGGNFFAEAGIDFGKVKLAHVIVSLIEARKLNLNQTANLFGISPARLGVLLNGRLPELSYDRLFRFLNALNLDIEVTLQDAAGGRAGVNVEI
jgi:predicted XRE-type DNA-binding protein